VNDNASRERWRQGSALVDLNVRTRFSSTELLEAHKRRLARLVFRGSSEDVATTPRRLVATFEDPDDAAQAVRDRNMAALLWRFVDHLVNVHASPAELLPLNPTADLTWEDVEQLRRVMEART
jgi:hypothetical protein